MRAAPPVDALLASGRKERAVIALLYALSFGAIGHWGLAHAGLAWQWTWLAMAVGAMLGVTVGAVVAGRLLPPPAQHLRWTGGEWQLGDLVLHSLAVRVDAGRWVLLHARADSHRTCWLVADAHHAGGAWHAMRLALQAHSPGPAR